MPWETKHDLPPTNNFVRPLQYHWFINWGVVQHCIVCFKIIFDYPLLRAGNSFHAKAPWWQTLPVVFKFTIIIISSLKLPLLKLSICTHSWWILSWITASDPIQIKVNSSSYVLVSKAASRTLSVRHLSWWSVKTLSSEVKLFSNIICRKQRIFSAKYLKSIIAVLRLFYGKYLITYLAMITIDLFTNLP